MKLVQAQLVSPGNKKRKYNCIPKPFFLLLHFLPLVVIIVTFPQIVSLSPLDANNLGFSNQVGKMGLVVQNV